ncbi:MAG: extracellular solute-binding protein, partial [Microbacterium sp.]
VLDSVNMAAQIRDQLDDGTMRVARIPAGASGKSVSAINVGGWYIPTNSQHPEAAIKFLEFLMATDNQVAHTTYGSVPILKSEAATYEGDYWTTIIDSVDEGVAEGVAPDVPALWTVTGEQLQALLTSGQRPADTLENIQAGHREVYDNR